MYAVLELHLAAKRGGCPDTFDADFKRHVGLALRKHMRAYTDAWIVPKHHYLWRAAAQAAEDGSMLD
eukprot:3170900-Pyramimonas_sp.AAC.1